MKHIRLFSLLTLLLVAASAAQSQTIITLTLDAKLLANPSCDLNLGAVPDNKVYAHTGICSHDPATSGTDAFANQVFCFTQITPFFSEVWQHVVGNWGDDPQDDGIGLMNYMGDGVWSKSINIEDYYSDPDTVNLDSSTVLPAGATAYVMGVVFRDKDGVFTGRDDQCKDIFIVEMDTESPRVVQGHDITKPFPPLTVTKAVGIKDIQSIAHFNSFPNPSVSHVNIEYFLRNAMSDVTVKVFNSLGQEVALLYKGLQDRGTHRFIWDGNSTEGTPAPGGIYHLVVNGSATVLATEKIVLVR